MVGIRAAVAVIALANLIMSGVLIDFYLKSIDRETCINKLLLVEQ